MQKSKIMNTYRSVKRRMQSRFIRGGVLSAKLFLVSSKKSEQDFLETYIETVRDDPHAIIVDEPQWVIKPAGTYSGRTFKVAVGDKIRKSKIVKDEDDLKDLLKVGYRVINVPIEFQRDFIRDVDQSLMEFAGISSSLTTKFISYEDLSKCYCESPNPFSRNVISIGTKDDILIQDFFKPELVNENLFSKPHYLHLDMSLTGDRTGISDVCIIGVRDEERYENGDFVPVREMVYKHVFSVAIQCPPGAGNEISLEKNRRFIYYLRHNLGWNIVGVSLDGYQSADTRQQLEQAGFNAKIISMDRTPCDGYMYLKASLGEHRIAMLNIPELESEVINLERNNMTGKVDHPQTIGNGIPGRKDMCLSYDTKLFLLSGRELTIEELFNDDSGIEDWIISCYHDKLVPVKIDNVIRKNFIPDKLLKITLDNGESFKVTHDHRVLLRNGNYVVSGELRIGDSLMPFTSYDAPIRAGIPITNHTIVSIDEVENDKPVYDLVLSSIHNYAISAGVFVHNCDSVAGALFNASQFEDKDNLMHIQDDQMSVVEVNDKITSTDLRKSTIDNFTKSLGGNPNSEKAIDEIFYETISSSRLTPNQEELINKERVEKLRSKLTRSESAGVSDDDLIDAYYGRDSDILIF